MKVMFVDGVGLVTSDSDQAANQALRIQLISPAIATNQDWWLLNVEIRQN